MVKQSKKLISANHPKFPAQEENPLLAKEIELPCGLHKLLFVKPQNHLCVTKNLLIHRGDVFEEKIKMSAPNPQQQRF